MKLKCVFVYPFLLLIRRARDFSNDPVFIDVGPFGFRGENLLVAVGIWCTPYAWF
jgi:hypothetical protein